MFEQAELPGTRPGTQMGLMVRLQGDVAFDDDISVSLLEVDLGGSTSAIGKLRMDDAEHEDVPMPQAANKFKLSSSSTMISVQKAWQLIPRLSCSILDVAERFEWLLSRKQTVLPIAAPFSLNAAMIRRSKTSQVSTINPIAISFFCARVALALRALYPLSRLI